MNPLAVSHCSIVTALGDGQAATVAALRESRTGLAPRGFETAALDTWLGVVEGLDGGDDGNAGARSHATGFKGPLAAFDCRNNRLAARALHSDGFADAVQQAAQRVGPARVGVFLGTSTSGILQTEIAYRHRDPATGALPPTLDYAGTHNTYSVARYVRAALGLQGPAQVVSTACSSGAKVFATAARMIALGVVDAAVLGGVDSLCMTTLYGFKSLELLSTDICRPWDADRNGLSIGEGAAFALLERQPPDPSAVCGWLLGAGESSDGHHMSSPHPEGAGAAAAMRGALAQAGLQAADVDYLNLHGTGTPGNDAAEDLAVCAVFGTALPCSSTKGHTGHTLGAAGAVEAVISLLVLRHGVMPSGLSLQHPDPTLHAAVLQGSARVAERPLRVVASNAFGFGGSNACLLFGADR
ncbi:MAG: beta-ketoacyl-ACP synthase [Rubrivivax sp.]